MTNAATPKLELLPKSFGWDAPAPVLPDASGFYPVAMPGRTVCV
jgi:myo-inositol 2-dehydrogenase / D-chiro-inositol 1-dehydrogenase